MDEHRFDTFMDTVNLTERSEKERKEQRANRRAAAAAALAAAAAAAASAVASLVKEQERAKAPSDERTRDGRDGAGRRSRSREVCL